MAVRAIDLFCGAGGSSCGARIAGARMVGAVDQWDRATETYADNFPEARSNIVTAGLTEFSGAEIFPSVGRVDLLLASPECTNHSLARGSRARCLESQRSGWYIARFVEDLAPEHIVLENVPMMRHWEGFEDLYRFLEKRHGYRLRIQVLDSADFGVPQSRKRLFIFGSRKRLPAKVEPNCRRPKNAESIIDPWGTWKAGPLDNGRRAEATLRRVRNAIDILGTKRDFLTIYYGSDKAGGYQTLDRPLRTLTTLDRFGLVQWHRGGPTLRMLQVPELKRAMGLPSGFMMDRGTRRDRIRLLGNGVCPPVMAAVVSALLGSGPARSQRGLANRVRSDRNRQHAS